MKRRFVIASIPREIRFTIGRILGISEESTDMNKDLILGKCKICHLHPSKKRRMTKYLCMQCKKPVCLTCTKPVCNDFAEKR